MNKNLYLILKNKQTFLNNIIRENKFGKSLKLITEREYNNLEDKIDLGIFEELNKEDLKDNVKNYFSLKPMYSNNSLKISSSLAYFDIELTENIISNIIYFYKNHFLYNQLNSKFEKQIFTKSIFNKNILIIGYNKDLDNWLKYMKKLINCKINLLVPNDYNSKIEGFDNVSKINEFDKIVPYNDIIINFSSNDNLFINNNSLNYIFKDHIFLNYGDISIYDFDSILSCLYDKRILGFYLNNSNNLLKNFNNYENIDRLVVDKFNINQCENYSSKIIEIINKVSNNN